MFNFEYYNNFKTTKDSGVLWKIKLCLNHLKMKYGINTGRFCLLFVLKVFYLEQFVVASVRYSRNAALDGLGCQHEDSVFHKHKITNKILCSSLCTRHKTCVGFFYITQLEECIGCRADFQGRTTTITDTEYYTRDGTLDIFVSLLALQIRCFILSRFVNMFSTISTHFLYLGGRST